MSSVFDITINVKTGDYLMTKITKNVKHEIEGIKLLVKILSKEDTTNLEATYEFLLKSAMTAGLAILVDALSKEQHKTMLKFAHQGDIFNDDEDFNPYDVTKHLIDLFPAH